MRPRNGSTILLATVLLSFAIPASGAKLTVGNGTATPGTSVTLPVTLAAEGAAVAGLQFDIGLPAGVSAGAVTAGAAAAAAGKQVQSATVPGGVRIIVWGLNTTSIGDGAVASVTLAVASSTPGGSLTITASGAQATDGSGAPVSLTTASGTITVSSVNPGKSMLLSQDRVSVSVRYRNQYNGATGEGTPVKQLDQYGYFWFDSAGNPEVFVKVLDFGGTNYLVFHSALSDLEYSVTFTVLRTGQSYVFNRPPGSTCGAADGSTVQK